jgi:hypothetical protein
MAQQNDNLKINSIPYTLAWDNQPLSYKIHNDILTIVAEPKTDMKDITLEGTYLNIRKKSHKWKIEMMVADVQRGFEQVNPLTRK